jgi:hypothetical protein
MTRIEKVRERAAHDRRAICDRIEEWQYTGVYPRVRYTKAQDREFNRWLIHGILFAVGAAVYALGLCYLCYHYHKVRGY